MAAETVLSHVDGEAGRLIIRGHDLESLAGRSSFEDAVAVLWRDLAPVDDIQAAMADGRARAFKRFTPMMRHLDGLTATEAMRACWPRFPTTIPSPCRLHC